MDTGTLPGVEDVVSVEDRQILFDDLWAISTAALASLALYVADMGDDPANYEVDGCRDMVDWVCARTHESRSRAHELVNVGTALRALPHIAQAVREARLSWSQVRHLVDIADADSDAGWAEAAPAMSESQLARTAALARKRAKARDEVDHLDQTLRFRHDRRHGGTHICAYLSAENAAVVEVVLADRAEHYGADPDGKWAPWPQRLATALVDTCAEAAADRQNSDPDRAVVTYHVDVDTATEGGWRFSSPRRSRPVWDAIDDDTLARVACDARCQTVYLRHGEPVFVDTKYRSPTAAQYRLLWERDGGCCTFPGCGATRLLHAHHIIHWHHGGPTELTNLTLLCPRHHHYVHEDGGTIEGNPYTQLTFRRPNGTAIPNAPPGLHPHIATHLWN